MPRALTDAIDIALDTEGGIVFKNGDLKLTTGLEAIAQEVRIALSTAVGEIYTDLDEGTPYFEQLLGLPFDEGVAQSVFRARALAVTHVNEVTSIEAAFNFATRELSVSFTANTTFGVLTDDVVIFPTV